mmetsp:Transcript_89151/g.109094  ORF Transcript_89151/g.109094 Transcript_89151/m.109094 type:complete len:204 (+) Transcript_89151:1031-1642(+)
MGHRHHFLHRCILWGRPWIRPTGSLHHGRNALQSIGGLEVSYIPDGQRRHLKCSRQHKISSSAHSLVKAQFFYCSQTFFIGETVPRKQAVEITRSVARWHAAMSHQFLFIGCEDSLEAAHVRGIDVLIKAVEGLQHLLGEFRQRLLIAYEVQSETTKASMDTICGTCLCYVKKFWRQILAQQLLVDVETDRVKSCGLRFQFHA